MIRILAGLLIGFALAAGCSSMSRLDAPRDRAWFDTGTPAPSLAPLRTTSFSVEDNGTVWDDGSRKQDSPK